MLLTSLLLITLLGGAQPFKISLKSPAATSAAAPLLPLQPEAASQVALGAEKGAPPKAIEQQREVQYQYQEQEPIRQTELSAGVKGVATHLKPEREIIPQPLAPQPTLFQPLRPLMPQSALFAPPPQALAYVIIRPLQAPQFQYLQPATLPEARPLATKGASQDEPIRQQQIPETTDGQLSSEQLVVQRPEPFTQEQAKEMYQHLQLVQQQVLPTIQQQPLAPVNPALSLTAGKEGFSAQAILVPIFAKKQAKLTKLKSSIDKIAQSALSKLTLGSSYQVIGEEIVPSPPSLQQNYQIQQEPIRQEQIEQLREEQIVQQQQQQQQQEPEVHVPQAEEFKLEPQAPVQQHQFEAERGVAKKELPRQPATGAQVSSVDGFGERESKPTKRDQATRPQQAPKAN